MVGWFRKKKKMIQKRTEWTSTGDTTASSNGGRVVHPKEDKDWIKRLKPETLEYLEEPKMPPREDYRHEPTRGEVTGNEPEKTGLLPKPEATPDKIAALPTPKYVLTVRCQDLIVLFSSRYQQLARLVQNM